MTTHTRVYIHTHIHTIERDRPFTPSHSHALPPSPTHSPSLHPSLPLLNAQHQGVRNLPAEEADRLTAADPDYSIRDLYNAIAEGSYPSWTVYMQVGGWG